MTFNSPRRQFLKVSSAIAGAGILQACTSPQQPSVKPTSPGKHPRPRPNVAGASMRLIAPSGFMTTEAQSQRALTLLTQAGFNLSNQSSLYRRYQRFAGTDAQRIADLQDIASGRVKAPDCLMAARGGYGAIRLLPHIDFAKLADKLREQDTLFIGYSDVTALQVALFAKGQYMSFAGPMAYSDFGSSNLSIPAMEGFITGTTEASFTIDVPRIQAQSVRTEGILWGGNLSVLASLAGTEYMPNVPGGILFLEDTSEQPYRIERMLQTLHLSGALKNQSAIILGDFNMGKIVDTYDSSYTLSTVAEYISKLTKTPVLTGFPFGHVRNKATFPLGARVQVRDFGSGYQVVFNDKNMPRLDAKALNLAALLPPPPEVNVLEMFGGENGLMSEDGL
ncbi:LD-carboxypeptidase [Neisseriaceae bacterium CLB008]